MPPPLTLTPPLVMDCRNSSSTDVAALEARVQQLTEAMEVGTAVPKQNKTLRYERASGDSFKLDRIERVREDPCHHAISCLQKMGQSITSPAPASAQPAPGVLSINQRTKDVRKHFPSALAVE
eukprot:scaffold11891_cov19-Tisochrysis_lutea.AAC.1